MIPTLSLMLASATLSATGASNDYQVIFDRVAPDGQREIKLTYQTDTFMIRSLGDQLSVDRREKALRANTKPEHRQRMRDVALWIAGCPIQNEFFEFYTFRLEATLTCKLRPAPLTGASR